MDPGLLTLGALAVGATALLPQFSKSRKEGFEVVPSGQYPSTAERGQELYNRLTLSSDPRAESIRLNNLPESEQNAYKRALDSVTSTTSVNFDSTGPSITTTATQLPVSLPQDDDILKRAAFCNSATITNDSFKNEKFKRDCGVCVSKGTSFDNKPFTGLKGMFILPEQKEAYIEERDKTGATYTKGKPSYGYCEGATAGADHNYTFALDEKELKLFSDRVKCQDTKTLDGNCATCLQDSSYTYVGKTGQSLDTLTFHIFGVNAIVTANLGGTQTDFKFPDGVKTFVSGSSGSAKFSLILKEGAFLNFTVSGWAGMSGANATKSNKQVVAQFWGILEFPNSTGGIERIPLDRILLKDEAVGRAPKYAKDFVLVNGAYCRKMVKPTGQESMMLTGQLPFLLVNNAPFEGIDCKGSLLQSMASSVEKFGGDPCYKPSTQGPGTWTDACLRDRIQTLGCTADGNLYKDPSSLRSLTMTQMIQTIQAIKSKQFSDNENSMKCNGRNISTPCDVFVNYDPEETPELSNQCIEYLYYNRGAERTNIGPTYSGPTSTFYSLDSAGKRIMCLPRAKMDPSVATSSMLTYLKNAYRNGYQGVTGLDAVKKIMNYHYNRAVNASLNANLDATRGGRKDSIENCFVSLANIPDNIIPDRKLPNARYCRVRYPPGRAECIQIGQIAVYDNQDRNIAFGKPVRASTTWADGRSGSTAQMAVDGTLQDRAFPKIFHSQCRANDFWLVDFTKSYPVKRIDYFNRRDCCFSRANGMLLELLDERMNVVWTQTLDANLRQTYYTFLKAFNV